MKINWKKISLGELAGLVSEKLKEKGIEAILVGGACATIYSQGRSQSYDLDYVVYEDIKKIREALSELGFYEKSKYFQRRDCKWLIEFVPSPVAVGREIIADFQDMEVSTGTIVMLRAEDSVKDRLASFFHWSDRQGLDQAVAICHECKVDMKEIEKWAIEEGFQNKFVEFTREVKNT
jgi:phosphopentomutase